jgi:hypothetical protein
MMVRRQVFEYLNGYDESLTYEDFDFWIRSAYCFEYKYIDFVSCKKRLHHQSLSSAFNKIGTQSLDESTYKVCLKINWLRKSEENKKALLKRLEYEISHSIRKLKMSILLKYFKLYLSVYFN